MPRNCKISSPVVLACLAILLIASPAFSQSAADARTLPNTQILGTEDPTKQITVAFWLKQHDKAGFDELVRQMYDKNSPNYHHWLTVKEYEARFAPSAADMAVVRQHLAAHNLKVVSTDKLNHAVTARGSVADVERAAGVQLNRASINGVEHRVPASEAVVPGAAGKVVAAVQGLSDLKYENYARRMVDPDTGKPVAIPLSTAPATTTKFFNAACLRGVQTRHFNTSGTFPTATYAGSRYGGIITDVAPNLPPCGYDAYEVQVAYGLKPLYNQRLNGNGQVVVLVDAYGSDTILADANAFSQINGLPALNRQQLRDLLPDRRHQLRGKYLWLGFGNQPRRGVVAHGRSGSLHRPGSGGRRLLHQPGPLGALRRRDGVGSGHLQQLWHRRDCPPNLRSPKNSSLRTTFSRRLPRSASRSISPAVTTEISVSR